VTKPRIVKHGSIHTNDREFSDIEIFNVREREYRCLCSYYVINTYASLMYELKKIGKVFTSKFVGLRALVLLKKNIPGRGLTKFEKHGFRAFSGTKLRVSFVCPYQSPFRHCSVPSATTWSWWQRGLMQRRSNCAGVCRVITHCHRLETLKSHRIDGSSGSMLTEQWGNAHDLCTAPDIGRVIK
jgi:hypothetical protein